MTAISNTPRKSIWIRQADMRFRKKEIPLSSKSKGIMTMSWDFRCGWLENYLGVSREAISKRFGNNVDFKVGVDLIKPVIEHQVCLPIAKFFPNTFGVFS